jgi:uncharacterized Zn finger protein
MERMECENCGFEGGRFDFKKMDNGNPLKCLDIYRCPECGHLFAPIPKAVLPTYYAEVLGIRVLEV